MNNKIISQVLKEIWKEHHEVKRERVIKEDLEFWETLMKTAMEKALSMQKAQFGKIIDKCKIISENSYGMDDGTDEILLVKYLIDKEELKQKLGEMK